MKSPPLMKYRNTILDFFLSRKRKTIFGILALMLFSALHPAARTEAEPAGAAPRLKDAASPYLRQHADNPVNWFPWGKEAFNRAKREDRPIFLSLGYSTCHWCSVMERESFADPRTAGLINRVFVPVLVDREERPDIDRLFMKACGLLTSACGWPLNVFLTPDLQPFYINTYIPRRTRFGRTGLRELIPRVEELWRNERDRLLESASGISKTLQATALELPGSPPDESHLQAAFQELVLHYDSDYGGFTREQKFSKASILLFLLRYWHRTGREAALIMVEHTLQAMRTSAVFDQLGFGFHRYTSDRRWRQPHFEKMLYDQAMLTLVYLEAFQATGRELYARTADEILTYALRSLQTPEGAFYTAENADSQGKEGAFYLWRESEIRRRLDHGDAALAIRLFNLTAEGNYLDPVTGEKTGLNTLFLDPGALPLGIHGERLRRKLFAIRNQRPHPEKDKKILTDWNGLMIAALARAGRILPDAAYDVAARKAASYLLKAVNNAEGELLHGRYGSQPAPAALAADYAYLIWGLIELFEMDFDVRWLEAALRLHTEFTKKFWDSKLGGYFLTRNEEEFIPFLLKEARDTGLPSANGVAMLNLLRMGRMTGDSDMEDQAEQLAQAFGRSVQKAPSAHAMLLVAADFALSPSREVVIVGRPEEEDTEKLLTAYHGTYQPNTILLFKPAGEDEPPILRHAAFLEFMGAVRNRATAYVCTDYNCKFPTNDPETMLELLGGREESGK